LHYDSEHNLPVNRNGERSFRNAARSLYRDIRKSA
jgi:hypothetical protein